MKQIYFAQKAFIVKDGTLLLVRKSQNDPNQPGKWEVPGGRMDFGEEIDLHLQREVREEVGIQVIPGPPFHIWQWRISRLARDGDQIEMQIVAVARLCEPLTTELSAADRVPEDYLEDMAWVPFQELYRYDLIENMLPAVDSFLRQVQQQIA